MNRHTTLRLSLLAALLMGCPPNNNSPTLGSIAITPPAPSLAAGTELQLVATGSYTNNTTANVSAEASWTSSNPAVVTVDSASARGRLRGVAAGTAEISATVAGVTGRVTVTVTAAELVSLTITPAAPSLPLGTQLQLVATGTFSNNTTQDLTSQVSWQSGRADVATVSNTAALQGQVTALAPGQTPITATLGTVTGSTTLTVTPATLRSIEITPPTSTLARSTTRAFVARGIYSDNTTQDLTTQVTWSTSDTSVAAISNAQGSQGLVTALAPGETTLTATLNGPEGVIRGTAALTVTSATLRSLDVTPTNPSAPLGSTQAFAATGTFSDNTTQDLTTQVTWSASDARIAAISNAAGSQGQATALALGQTTITATLGTISGTTTIAVTPAILRTIDITPPASTLARYTTRAFVAMGVYSDNTTRNLTTQVTWSSSDTSVATISNAQGSQGLATALNPGETTLTATLSDTLGTIRGTATLTVTSATLRSIGIAPTNPSVPLGAPQAFAATGTFSDNTTQDLTPQVTWSSSTPAIATVSNAAGTQGRATTLAVGETTVFAAYNGVTGATSLTVTPAALVSIGVTPANPSVIQGLTQPFVATGVYTDQSTQDLTPQVAWSSSDPGIATISNAHGSQGRATGVAVGQTTITAALDNISGTTTLTVAPVVLRSISVDPPMASIPRGTTQAFIAMGIYNDNSTRDLTTQVAWSSSNATIAPVSNAPGTEGLATGLDVGQTTITAALGTISASATLTVTPAVLRSLSIMPGNPALPIDLSQPFAAIGLYSDDTTQDLTAQASWSSSNPSVATISNATDSRGLALALTPGQTTITATLGAASATTTLTVTSARLTSLSVTPDTATILRGGSQAFTATGRFDDGSMRDLTSEVTWTSDDTSIATVSNVPGSQGLARNTDTIGTARISASLGSLRASATLVISLSPLRSIAITPASPSIPRGISLSLTATGTLQDGTTVDITRAVTWQSTSPSVAFVSNALPDNTTDPGQARSFNPGQTTITASYDGVTGSTPLTVTTARLVSLQITPANPSLPVFFSRQLTATGTYDDGTTRDLTTEVYWSASDPNVASVYSGFYAYLIPGRVSGWSAGQTTITASHEALTATTTLTVTQGQLVDLTITPDRATIARGRLLQFTATGTFDDGNVLDLTDQVFWDSSNFNVAPFRFVATSSRTYSYGLAVGQEIGNTVISATLFFTGRQAFTTLAVTESPPVVISITPRAAILPQLTDQQFIATGVYADGTIRDISRLVTWTSSNTAVANRSNQTGLFFALAAGQTTISASLGDLTGSALLTVTDARLVSIAVTPATPSVPLGRSLSFEAIGTFSDGRTQDVTRLANWAAADPQIASRSINAANEFQAAGVGQTAISATLGSLTGTTGLTVTAAVPVGVSLGQSLASDRLALNDGIRVQAFLRYSDGTRFNVTDQATWTSSDPRVVEIRSGTRPGERVLASVNPGRVQITVDHGGFTVNDELEVSPFTIQGIRLYYLPTPSPPGRDITALAEIQWSNGASFDTGSHVVWSSSDPSVASIIDDLSAGRFLGSITPLTSGQTLITVQSVTGPASASALLTVQ